MGRIRKREREGGREGGRNKEGKEGSREGREDKVAYYPISCFVYCWILFQLLVFHLHIIFAFLWKLFMMLSLNIARLFWLAT